VLLLILSLTVVVVVFIVVVLLLLLLFTSIFVVVEEVSGLGFVFEILLSPGGVVFVGFLFLFPVSDNPGLLLLAVLFSLGEVESLVVVVFAFVFTFLSLVEDLVTRVLIDVPVCSRAANLV